jgi:hypothetical protein
MTMSGRVKYYGAGVNYTELDEITPGPDGAMWFTSTFGPSAIGRITAK